MRPESRVYDLKARLDWGEPALTIVDIRDRASFGESHVMGAISMPIEQLIGSAVQTLEFDRDLYVYGNTDEEAAMAAQHLREAGFQYVSVLRGGVAAWKAVGFPVESTGIAVA